MKREEALETAAKEFVERCERGEVKSVKSRRAFEEALALPKDDTVDKLQSRIELLNTTVAILKNILEICMSKFQFYEFQHRAKKTPESLKKAEVNCVMKNMCYAAVNNHFDME